MKLLEIMELIKCNKKIAIITPNKIESKLIYDRFLCSKLAYSYNPYSLIVNDSEINIATIDEAPGLGPCDHYIVTFPESIPEFAITRLQAMYPSEISFLHSEIRD